ncbi:anti-sigma factor [Granulicella paludicola]|uniref:hypothetical protein n=1 Tax=Granulicella paludicola TaxID=474951 RepID=UPI0021DF4CD2|nr:hypothetical protein [Granulicella paludicola]
MTMQGQHHLTDEQFADSFLGGVVPAEVQAHLDGCEACRQELNGFAQSMDSFSEVAMAWSEAQPTFSPRSLTIGPVKVVTSRRHILAHAGWVLAGVLVLAVSVPAIWHREHQAVAVRQPAPLAVQEDSAEQILQDNDLMQSVDVALQADDPSPFSEYRIEDLTGKRMKDHRGVRVQ